MERGRHRILVLWATLEGAVSAAGGDVVSLDAKEEPGAQFRRSGAAIAVADMGGAAWGGLAAAVELHGGALVAIGTDADAALTAGATHFVAAPATREAIAQALRFAERHVERVNAGERRAVEPWTDDRALTAVRAALATHEPVAVVIAALSRLDLANAAHGRAAIDELLDAVEARIRATLPGAHTARLHGARFVVAVAGEASVAGAALGEALAQPFAGADGNVAIGARLGVADGAADADPMSLLRRAIDAIGGERQVDQGSMKVARAGPSTDQLAIDLHRAIDRDEIAMRFQPQVDMTSGRIVGVEALARWDHPTLGPLGADTLFAAADRADLGLALSDRIQRLALARGAAWTGPLATLRLAINLTAADVARSGFAATFLDRVAASGFAAERLTVEITESGLIEDLGSAAALLDQLRTAGCRVAIDDFGTGYSSLAYLTALPLDYLKLDRALVRGIDGAERDRVVVRGTIAMAKALGFTVIAEGVETRAQRYQLAALGCDLYQGFLCAGALDEGELRAMVGLER